MSEPASKLSPIKPASDARLVEALERWLEEAKSGELAGAVLLGNNRGGEFQFSSAGDCSLGKMMVAFEAFKLDALEVVRRQ